MESVQVIESETKSCNKYYIKNRQTLLKQKKEYYQQHKDEIKAKEKQRYILKKQKQKEKEQDYERLKQLLSNLSTTLNI
jgi:hypothetical protein